MKKIAVLSILIAAVLFAVMITAGCTSNAEAGNIPQQTEHALPGQVDDWKTDKVIGTWILSSINSHVDLSPYRVDSAKLTVNDDGTYEYAEVELYKTEPVVTKGTWYKINEGFYKIGDKDYQFITNQKVLQAIFPKGTYQFVRV